MGGHVGDDPVLDKGLIPEVSSPGFGRSAAGIVQPSCRVPVIEIPRGVGACVEVAVLKRCPNSVKMCTGCPSSPANSPGLMPSFRLVLSM